jgi:hypothetical protein
MAAPTYAQFIVSFPEFDQVTQAYVQAKIDEADTLLDADAFGADLHYIAVGYKAAHLLAMSPYGTQLQLVNDNGSTVYERVFVEQCLPRVAHRGFLCD